MIKITKKQQVSLARKWHQDSQGMTYLQFRRTIQPTFGNDGCIMVAWCGMFLGMETDGYCHS